MQALETSKLHLEMLNCCALDPVVMSNKYKTGWRDTLSATSASPPSQAQPRYSLCKLSRLQLTTWANTEATECFEVPQIWLARTWLCSGLIARLQMLSSEEMSTTAEEANCAELPPIWSSLSGGLTHQRTAGSSCFLGNKHGHIRSYVR